MPPALSVIVPTYQRRVLVERLLYTLSQQTFSPEAYEVIIVVDGWLEKRKIKHMHVGYRFALDDAYWVGAQQALRENRRAGQGLTLSIGRVSV